MNTEFIEWVNASPSSPVSVWGFYDSREEAEADLPRALEYQKEQIKTWDKNRTKYPCESNERYYAQALAAKPYEPVTYGRFLEMEREAVLTGEVHKETRDEYWDALECLPPILWKQSGGFDTFCMSEFLTGTYTSQHARLKHDGEEYHVSKTVDAYDKTTWLTPDDIKLAYGIGD